MSLSHLCPSPEAQKPLLRRVDEVLGDESEDSKGKIEKYDEEQEEIRKKISGSCFPPDMRADVLDFVFNNREAKSLQVQEVDRNNAPLVSLPPTTITLKPTNIKVELPSGLSEKKFLAFSPFSNWYETLTHSLSLQHVNPKHPFHSDPYSLKSIEIQSFDLFGKPPHQRLGFLKLVADVSNAAGESLPGSVFLRGPSVAMLIILVPNDVSKEDKDTHDIWGERYVVLTVQPRIPAGSLEFVELPAGMVDEGGSFAGAAAQEIREELGLEVSVDEMRCMTELADTNAKGDENLPAAMFPSAGGCDEHIAIYMHERRVPRETLKEWTGKLTGLRDHGEKITLKLVKMKDLWQEGARDAKCLSALALWEALRRQGEI
ncbi:hypothetical protein F4805DRAFT_17221 [Annulohypoxylon moriforme]|nr:hypothetical protein F4805DRAFT_17221 [Annulohypoxylon moriforme]